MRQTLFYRVTDGGQSCNDALVLEISTVMLEAILDAYRGIRDLAIFHGNVEVDPDQHPFASEIKIVDGQLVRNGHGCGWRREERKEITSLSAKIGFFNT